MAIIIKNIIPRKQIEAAQTSQYTANGVKTIIDKFTITNIGTSDITISVNLVPNGGSASNSNLVVKNRVIAPNQTYDFPQLISQVLEVGGFISTLSDSTNGVLSASGREIS